VDLTTSRKLVLSTTLYQDTGLGGPSLSAVLNFMPNVLSEYPLASDI
jgi:hypothetical protein